MGITRHQFIDENLTFYKATSIIHANEVLEEITRYFRGTQTKYVIWDFTHADLSKINESTVRHIMKTRSSVKRTRSEGKVGLVIGPETSRKISIEATTYADIFTTPHPLERFLTVKEALFAFNIPAEIIHTIRDL